MLTFYKNKISVKPNHKNISSRGHLIEMRSVNKVWNCSQIEKILFIAVLLSTICTKIMSYSPIKHYNQQKFKQSSLIQLSICRKASSGLQTTPIVVFRLHVLIFRKQFKYKTKILFGIFSKANSFSMDSQKACYLIVVYGGREEV